MEKDQDQNLSNNAGGNYYKSESPEEVRSSLGINENLAALLCYVFGWISGLIFMLTEKNSKLVKFHAIQSLFLGIVVFLIYFILDKLFLSLFWYFWPMISLLTSLIELAYVIVSIFLAVKAYHLQRYELPIIGNIAKNMADK